MDADVDADSDVTDEQVATGEALAREQLRSLVRRQPWLTVAAAAAAGGMLGGLWFSQAGRLVFAAASGFVVHDLWRARASR